MTANTAVLLGGSGFIGTALARCLLSEGVPLRIADIRPSALLPGKFVRADVRDSGAVAKACDGAETLYLLAAEHGLEPRPAQQFEQVNVGGARAVVAAAERAGLQRIVLTSTVAVYGLTGVQADEDTPCRPTSEYGRTKLAAELILRDWAGADPRRSLVIIRPTLVFGAGVRGHMRALLERLVQPGFVMIGSGQNRKSLAYVDNLAAFHAFAGRADPGVHTFNYADGPDLTMAELADEIRAAVGLPAVQGHLSKARALLQALVRGGAAGDYGAMSVAQVRRFCANSEFKSLRMAATGFQPPLALRDALRRYAHSDLRWLVPGAPAMRSAPVPA